MRVEGILGGEMGAVGPLAAEIRWDRTRARQDRRRDGDGELPIKVDLRPRYWRDSHLAICFAFIKGGGGGRNSFFFLASLRFAIATGRFRMGYRVFVVIVVVRMVGSGKGSMAFGSRGEGRGEGCQFVKRGGET